MLTCTSYCIVKQFVIIYAVESKDHNILTTTEHFSLTFYLNQVRQEKGLLLLRRGGEKAHPVSGQGKRTPLHSNDAGDPKVPEESLQAAQ